MGRRFAGQSTLAVALAALAYACSDGGAGGGYAPPPIGDDGGVAQDASLPPDDAAIPPVDGAAPPDTTPLPCTTRFTFAPNGRAVGAVSVTGEWNGFAQPGVAMTKQKDGAWTADVELPAGLVAYRFVVDGAFELDDGSALRKYVGGIENSAVRVADCRVPQLTLFAQDVARAAGAQGKPQGRYRARVAVRDGHDAAGIDPHSVRARLRRDGVEAPLQNATFDAATSTITLDAPGLADGKYTIFVDASDRAGHAAKPLRLVFWIEAERFDWRDALIYMVMTDRFVDADPTSDVTGTPNVDARADWQGGDLQGVKRKIDDGTFDRLGVRALWLSPFHVNPKGSYPAADGVHQMTGYHGYWPIRARGVEPRIGGDQALRDLVAAAHAHGIRVLQDFVVNHVHKEHEYFAQHPDWFRTGCVCGTANCDWTTHRLDCLFADYLPDVNWTVPEVSERFGDDAVWWLDAFDLDGLRIDAVKHVEDACIMNLSARIRGELEATGTRVFLTGETAMGWSDCGLACNADQYGTIARYIGPHGLDGQFDFVLYYAVPSQVLMRDGKGMVHADYWSQASGWEYPAGAIMTPYIGSQDTPRFVTLATYRGQDAAHATSVPGNQWNDPAEPPGDPEPFARQRLALAWLLTQPGAPMLYYGDEYGQWGGADPNNRKPWREGAALSGDEQATLARAQALGQARRDLVALRRGKYVPVDATEDVLVFARRTDAGDAAIVALSRSAAAQTLTTSLPITLDVPDGTTLHDRLGGPDVIPSGGAITIALPPRGAAILAP